jgi:hypothetical protein
MRVDGFGSRITGSAQLLYRAAIIFLFAASLNVPSIRANIWTASSPGDLLTGSNWYEGFAPNGIGASAAINELAPTDNNADIFLLHGSMTLGTLTYTNPRFLYIFGSSGTLHFLSPFGPALFDQETDGGLSLQCANIVLDSTLDYRDNVQIGSILKVPSQISGNGGLIKSGQGELVLNNANNDYLGLNDIRNGALSGTTIDDEGINCSFGLSDFAISRDGVLAYDGATAETNRSITLRDGFGSVAVDQPDTTLTWNGPIVGSQQLFTKYGPGTLYLGSDSNSFRGVDVYAGTLVIGYPGALPTGAEVINTGIFQADADIISIGGTTLIADDAFVTAGSVEARGLSIEVGGGVATGIGVYRPNSKLIAGELSISELTVTLANGFTPHAGNSFDILDWQTLDGGFSVNLPPLPTSLSWDESQLFTAGVLSVVAALTGDYNHDGVVNAADYTIWRDTLGSTTDLRADGNNNGVIDQGDYDIWTANFGKTSNNGLGSGARVPEPQTVDLLVVGCVACLVTMRHARR